MRIVINMQSDGCFEVFTDEECEVFVVNDHCKGDRVYRLSSAHTVSPAEVDRELGGDVVGHAGDARHAAIEHRILRKLDGKSHLETVK